MNAAAEQRIGNNWHQHVAEKYAGKLIKPKTEFAANAYLFKNLAENPVGEILEGTYSPDSIKYFKVQRVKPNLGIETYVSAEDLFQDFNINLPPKGGRRRKTRRLRRKTSIAHFSANRRK